MALCGVCCSTGGILAALLATVRQHQQRHGGRRRSKVVLPRNIHKSAINGLILSGADPVFLGPVYDPYWDLCHGIPTKALAEALHHHHGQDEIAAVLLVSPTYHGAITDLGAAVSLCNQYGGIPLIVDEAHGAHLQFMEVTHKGGLAAGAHIVVQSTHKTLTAFSQAAMLHAGTSTLLPPLSLCHDKRCQGVY